MKGDQGIVSRYSLFIFCVTLLVPLAACRQQSTVTDKSNRELPRLLRYQKISLPVFDSAREQLAYAYSLPTGSERQKKAFRFVAEHFPEDRLICGRALLQSAYLELGEDYRLSDRDSRRRALFSYMEIAGEYDDIGAVRAKALWYMGWIHSDLLGERERGLALYRLLAEEFGTETPPRPEEPTPLVSFVYPQARNNDANGEPPPSWPALALLEIIKNEAEMKDRLRAMNRLLALEAGGRAAGLGLLHLLRGNADNKALRAAARDYLAGKNINPALASDIRAILNNYQKKNGDGNHHPEGHQSPQQ